MSFALDTPGCVISDPGLWTNVTTFVALALGAIFGFCKLGLLLHCLGHVLTPRVHRGGGALRPFFCCRSPTADVRSAIFSESASNLSLVAFTLNMIGRLF